MDLQDKLRYVLDLFNELDREIYLKIVDFVNIGD